MSSSYAEALGALHEPAPESRVMMRWWWFGGALDERSIDRQLGAMAAAGIGGVEVAFVYGLDPARTDRFDSPRVRGLIGYAARRAKERGLRFDLTLGSGWSFGGSHVSRENAAQCLRWEERSVGPGQERIRIAPRWPGDAFLAAFLRPGSVEDPRRDYVALEAEDGAVVVPAGRGTRSVLLAFVGQTGQLVKRATTGVEGWVLDHYSRQAASAHLADFADPLWEAAGGTEHVHAVFCDSLETYLADWTPAMPEEFLARRGYPLLPVLSHLWSTDAGADGLRADYYRTLSELYEENFLAVVHDWASARGVAFRVQNYGHPPARVSGYRLADLIEGEGWGWRGIPQTKWASSAAHHRGVGVVSSETWTWVNSPSFRARPLDLKGEAHEHVLSGVNQLIGHGWPASAERVPAPGWAFYASGALSDRNAWWSAAPSLFGYLHRLSSVMREGEQVADVGLWLPYDDVYAGFAPGDELNLWQGSARRIGDRVTALLREAGYDFDVIDAQTPAESILRRHRVIVVARAETLSDADAGKLRELVAQGLSVVFADSPAADRVAGSVRSTQEGLADVLGRIVAPDARIEGRPDLVGVVHRRLSDGELYFVANTSPQAQEAVLHPRDPYASWRRWDARSGASGERRGGGIRLELAPYEAAVVLTSAVGTDPIAADPGARASTIPLPSWRFRHPDGSDVPVRLPHVWEEHGLTAFSGTASYEGAFTLAAVPASCMLVLDTAGLPVPPRTATQPQSFQAHAAVPLGVVAEVFVNDERAGVIWDAPWEVDISALVVPGRNTIRLAVGNTSVNAMRDPAWLRMFDDADAAFGRKFLMQDMDQIARPTVSGLLTTPLLRIVES